MHDDFSFFLKPPPMAHSHMCREGATFYVIPFYMYLSAIIHPSVTLCSIYEQNDLLSKNIYNRGHAVQRRR